MLAVLTQSVSPSAYSLTLSLYLLLAIVVGGLGSLAGAAWGSLLLVLSPELTNTTTERLHLSPEAARRLAGNLPLAVFGLTLVLVMIAAPGGLQGLLRRGGRGGRGWGGRHKPRPGGGPGPGPPARPPARAPR